MQLTCPITHKSKRNHQRRQKAIANSMIANCKFVIIQSVIFWPMKHSTQVLKLSMTFMTWPCWCTDIFFAVHWYWRTTCHTDQKRSNRLIQRSGKKTMNFQSCWIMVLYNKGLRMHQHWNFIDLWTSDHILFQMRCCTQPRYPVLSCWHYCIMKTEWLLSYNKV